MKKNLHFFKNLFLIFSVLLLFSCKKNIRTTTAIAGSFSNTVTYQLVWADEFEGPGINTANWNFETGGGGWGNNEQQYYQAANATISNATW